MTQADIEEAEEFVGASGRRKEVDANSRTSLIVQVPIAMKVALEKYVKENNVNQSEFCRRAIAEQLGFELPATTEKARPTSKLSEEEKKARAAARGKEQREMIRLMLAKVRADEGLEEEDDEDDEDEA